LADYNRGIGILREKPCLLESFEKFSILFKVKEGENFKHRNT